MEKEMIENCKAIQSEYEIDDETMGKIIATTPDNWDEVTKLAYIDYSASQLKGFKDNMKKHMGIMEAKKREEEKMKEKEYVLGKKITEGKYNGMIFYNNPRNLPEATEEELKDENVYTIKEKLYNDNKKWIIFNYDNAQYRIMQSSKALYNAYNSMYGLTRMTIEDTIERCEDFIDYIKQYNESLALSLKLVKSSLEKALLEINKTTDQHSKIEHIYDGR